MDLPQPIPSSEPTALPTPPHPAAEPNQAVPLAETLPGLDEVIALLARGLARALAQSGQPCPPAEGKSPRPQ